MGRAGAWAAARGAAAAPGAVAVRGGVEGAGTWWGSRGGRAGAEAAAVEVTQRDGEAARMQVSIACSSYGWRARHFGFSKHGGGLPSGGA